MRWLFLKFKIKPIAKGPFRNSFYHHLKDLIFRREDLPKGSTPKGRTFDQ